MTDVSAIIPARNERFLAQTIKDLVAKKRGDTEIIAVLEGYWPDEMVEDASVHYVHNTTPRGMRGAINQGAALARGKFLMKCDAHCLFDEGFDVKLAADIEDNQVVVPRRYALDADNWTTYDKRPVDYMYLCYPDNPGDFGGPSLKGRIWPQRDDALRDVEIDDLMSSQGSCWFMPKAYYEWLELLDEENYGHFSNEFQEIGLKVWLSGGRCVVNKRTWYAHLHKGKKYGRGWPLGSTVLNQGATFTNRWMDGRNWHKQDRDIRWMVNRFWPVPTWPEESVRLVFHRARHGGSGEIRGTQMAKHFKARLNPPEWAYDFDVHVWVKMEPKDLSLPGRHYLDVLDAQERVSWLLKNPECGVIASSLSGQEYLKKKLNRKDVLFIPQHHCNFDRAKRERDGIKVAGVAGGDGAIRCDMSELKTRLADMGIEFRWLNRYESRDEVDAFYRELDVQIVWRGGDRPLKNPLKIINAMSYGIPTIALPEPAYEEVWGYYWVVQEPLEILMVIEELKQGWDALELIDFAEQYHIENVAKLYRGMLR
jgi:glycosyltransferase involved in cell wall biosynthesis